MRALLEQCGQRRWCAEAAALTCILSLALTSGCSPQANTGPPPPEVPTAKVLSKRITDWDEFTGRFQAVDSVRGAAARLRLYRAGPVPRRPARSSKDDVLFIIDPRPYQADYDRARAGLALARSQHELAKLEADRVQKLKDSGAVSREEYDERLSLLNQQEASVTAARATLDTAALMLSFTKVLAPVDGRVGRAEVTRGNLVTGGNERRHAAHDDRFHRPDLRLFRGR